MSIKLEKRWIEMINDLIKTDFRIEDYRFEDSLCYQEVLDHLANASIDENSVSFKVVDDMSKQSKSCKLSSIVERFDGCICYAEPRLGIAFNFTGDKEFVKIWCCLKNITSDGKEFSRPYVLDDGEKMDLEDYIQMYLRGSRIQLSDDDEIAKEQIMERLTDAAREDIFGESPIFLAIEKGDE